MENTFLPNFEKTKLSKNCFFDIKSDMTKIRTGDKIEVSKDFIRSPKSKPTNIDGITSQAWSCEERRVNEVECNVPFFSENI